MGENEHQKHPLVAPPTQSVDSKPRIRLKSNSTSTCEFQNTLRRGDLIAIGRPIWMKVQESECRLAFWTYLMTYYVC